MKHVRLVGWKPGLKKITLVDLLKQYGGYNLGTAHQAMVTLMEGGIIDVKIDDALVQEFIQATEAIGAVYECRDD